MSRVNTPVICYISRVMASLLGKNWVLKHTDSSKNLTEKLLHNRNLKTEEEIDSFLNPDHTKHFHDPFLMRDMGQAVTRINQALQKKERILVFGDYDVDGITGTAILIHTLRSAFSLFHGQNVPETVSYRLPHRVKDGYGLREKFIKEFAKLNVKLLITVDNGISAAKEIALAESLGIDVIITDHHTLPETLPKAHAILHPKLPDSTYPFEGLTGAGVAFKLAKALIIKNFPKEEHEERIFPLLDLACMGTIADLGPLRGENRIIVKYGLKVLEQTRWPGLSRLKKYAGVEGKVDTRSVGFFLSPRLNAAGRIAHPHYALQLLLGDDTTSEKFASYLNQLNQKRQKLVEENLQEAFAQAEKQKKEGQKILLCSHPDWHTGIIGLLAGRLTETYGMPAIAMEDRGETLIGSARSISSCNILEAIREASSLLVAFGGHAQAAGFELKKENLPAFVSILQPYAVKTWAHENFSPELSLECEITPPEISFETLRVLECFEPFGFDNETPKFLLRNALVEEKRVVGQTGKHLKLRVNVSGKTSSHTFFCIGFQLGNLLPRLQEGIPYDLAVTIEKNVWQGEEKLELKLLDISQNEKGA